METVYLGHFQTLPCSKQAAHWGRSPGPWEFQNLTCSNDAWQTKLNGDYHSDTFHYVKIVLKKCTGEDYCASGTEMTEFFKNNDL